MSVRRVPPGFFPVMLLGLALAAPPLRAAQPPEEESATLPEVLVTASRSPGSLLDVREFPGNATVITAPMIARSGATSVPQLLSAFEGLTVLDTHGFGLGSDASVNLRGVVNSSRTGALVLVNGVRQNRPTGDEVHWQSLPVSEIDRIEIIRGGGGLAYGEGALSGVINILTKKGAQVPLALEQRVEVGSFGQQTYGTSARGGMGPWRYGTSFTRRTLSGYRENTNSRMSTTTAHLGVDPTPELHLETNVLHSEDTTGFPGGITPEASQARRRQRGSFFGFIEDHTTQVSLDGRLTGPAGLSAAATGFVHARESDLSSPFGLFATISPAKGLSLRLAHEGQQPSVRHTLVGVLDLLDEKASVGTRGTRLDESNKSSLGLFLEETLRLWDRLTLMAGLRADRSRFEEDISFPAFVGTLRFSGVSPKLGATLDVTKHLSVYARYARPFKAPEVDDFSAVVTTPFVGNISLQPQQGDDYELGTRLVHPVLGEAEATMFFNRINKEILFNDSAFQNQNMDTERFGIELSAQPRLPWPQLTSRLTYTFLEAEFRKGEFRDHTIPGVPEHRVTTHLSYEPVPGLFFTADWRLVHDIFRINDFANTLPGDNYGVLDLGLRFVYEQVTVYFRVENAANEEYTTFQSSSGSVISSGENPAPPTTFIGGVTVRF